MRTASPPRAPFPDRRPNAMLRKKIKVTLRKLGRVRVDGSQVDGLAFRDEGRVEIDSRLKGRHQFEIFAHEALHIICPDMAEPEVVRVSKQLTRFLWEQGFRKVDL